MLLRSLATGVVIAFVALAIAQDRRSVEQFLIRYTHAEEVRDFDTLIASLDSTLLWRWPGGLETYASMKAGFLEDQEIFKGKPLPNYVIPGSVTFDRIEIVGKRAIVDSYNHPGTTRKGEKPGSEGGHMILVWHEDGWKIWRFDALPRK